MTDGRYSHVLLLGVFMALCGTCLARHGRSDVTRQQQPRIVNGIPAFIEDFPYTVALMIRNNFRCAGSIISPFWVLSAAHCTNGKNSTDMTVRAGSTRWNAGGSLHGVRLYLDHEMFDPETLDHDITAIKVWIPFAKSRGIQLPPIGLLVKPNKYCTAVGWGVTEQFYLTTYLRQVTVPSMSNEQCSRYYHSGRITNGMMCTGHPSKWLSPCWGDSGGPLLLDGQLVGVISWAEYCGPTNMPAVYTRVSHYRDWITKTTGV